MFKKQQCQGLKLLFLGLGSFGALPGWVSGGFGDDFGWDSVPLKTLQKLIVCLFIGPSWKSWFKTWRSSSFCCSLVWFPHIVCFNKKVGNMKSLDVVSFVSPLEKKKKKHCEYVLDTHSKNGSCRNLLFGVPDVGFYTLKKEKTRHLIVKQNVCWMCE